MKDPLKLRRSIQLTACAALITTALYPAAEATAIEKIQRYCTASWKNAGISDYDWDDCSQEAIENLLERVSRAGLTAAINRKESDERRELNRSIWRTAQRWRRAKRPTSLDALESFQPVAPPIDNGHSEKSEMLDALRDATDGCHALINTITKRSTLRGGPMARHAARALCNADTAGRTPCGSADGCDWSGAGSTGGASLPPSAKWMLVRA